MEPGLKTAEQHNAARIWLSGQIDAAKVSLISQPTVDKYPSVSAFNAAVAVANKNPFKAAVEEVYNNCTRIDASGKPVTDEAAFNAGIQKLKEDKLKEMIDGKPRKGFMEILQDSFANFDIMNPGSIITILISAVKELALSYGGEMIGPFAKSMRDGTTQEAATQSLQFKNSAEKLADSLGLTGDAAKGFVATTTADLDATAAKMAPTATPTNAAVLPGKVYDAKSPATLEPLRKLFADPKALDEKLAAYPADQKPVVMVVANDKNEVTGVFIGSRDSAGNFKVDSMLKSNPDGSLKPVKTNIASVTLDGKAAATNYKYLQSDVALPRGADGSYQLTPAAPTAPAAVAPATQKLIDYAKENAGVLLVDGNTTLLKLSKDLGGEEKVKEAFEKSRKIANPLFIVTTDDKGKVAIYIGHSSQGGTAFMPDTKLVANKEGKLVEDTKSPLLGKDIKLDGMTPVPEDNSKLQVDVGNNVVASRDADGIKPANMNGVQVPLEIPAQGGNARAMT